MIDSVLQEVIPDTLPPTVTVEQGGHPDPDPDSTVYFDISLSEAVTGFSTEDILISGSATAQVVALVGMGTSYQVAISDVGDGESVTVSIPANTMNDLAGNPNLASTSTDNTITVLYPRPGQCADTSGAGFTQFTDITTPCRVGTLTTGDTVGDDGLYDWTCV